MFLFLDFAANTLTVYRNIFMSRVDLYLKLSMLFLLMTHGSVMRGVKQLAAEKRKALTALI